MKKEIENKLELANLQIKKVVDFIKENKNAFDYMNLKLHDVLWYCGSDEMEKDFPLCYEKYKDNLFENLFCDFCDIEYEVFKENLMTEYEIDFEKMIEHIGHTSSFYLYDFFNIDDRIDYILSDLYDKFAGDYESCFLDFNEKGELFVSDNDYDETIIQDIDYFINDFYNDVIGELKNIVNVYNKIKNFKENQVAYFKDYLENEEERLFNEQEEEREIEEEKRKTVKEIKEKYGISDKDIQRLKFNL